MEEQQHKRRVRYKGTHPRSYQEKYKEHNPEKYADTVAKVIAKGSTPAGMHISIMVEEILDFLQIQPGQKGLDATLGYGGHTRNMLEQQGDCGLIVGLDVDPIESEKTEKRLRDAGYSKERFRRELINFEKIDEVCEKYGKFDFVLADLGVSSMQIDNPERGFSYKNEGPLDLRLNPKEGIPASERLCELSKDEVYGMLVENSDEPYALELSKVIYEHSHFGKKIETTSALKELIEATIEPFLCKNSKEEIKEIKKKTCQRVFQAIRIDVNSEFEVLDSFLQKLPHIMNPGGRIAILTFHSGEDRMVKKAFRAGKGTFYQEVSKDVIRPSAKECRENGRARSTKMRWAIRNEYE